MSLLCSFKRFVKIPRCFSDVFKFTIFTRDTINTGVWKLLHWELECTNSRIVLEGKEVVLILSLFKLFILLWEKELFGKVMNPWGELVLSDIQWGLVGGWFLL